MIYGEKKVPGESHIFTLSLFLIENKLFLVTNCYNHNCAEKGRIMTGVGQK